MGTLSRSPSALSLLLAIVLANLVLQPLTEPDFGWHLRTGLDLLKQGRLPALDPYSYTMPDWPWVEHAWLTDLLLGLLYAAGGSAGTLCVILFFALVTATAWIMAAGCATARMSVRLLACSLSLWVALPFLGARTQAVTWLGLAVLMRLLDRLRSGPPSLVWWIPPMMLLWANLHGGFTAGLFLLTLVVSLSWSVALVGFVRPKAGESDRDWRYPPGILWRLAAATVIGGLLTLINPYGWALHKEIVDSLSDRYMIEVIREWHSLSPDTLAGRMFLVYLAALALALACWYRRVEPVRWGVLTIFLGLACWHLRNIPLFLIVTVPLVADLLQEGVSRLAAHSMVKRISPAQWRGGLALVLGLALFHLGSDHLEGVFRFGLEPAVAFRQTSYPIEAVEWVQAHRDRIGTRPVHDYQFGGFLLWWLPDQKVFIDGRMPAWRIGERWIFKDYVAVCETEVPRLAVLEKYAVDWALLKRDSPLARTLAGLPDWRKEYEDGKVVILTAAWARTMEGGGYSRTGDEEARGESSRAITRLE
jgi:hypothetical protein